MDDMRRSMRIQAVHPDGTQHQTPGDQASQEVSQGSLDFLGSFHEYGQGSNVDITSFSDNFDFQNPSDQQQPWPTSADPAPWSLLPADNSNLANSSESSLPVHNDSTDPTSYPADDDLASRLSSQAPNTNFGPYEFPYLGTFTNPDLCLEPTASFFNQGTLQNEDHSQKTSPQTTEAAQASSSHVKTNEYKCRHCQKVLRCPSELQKHTRKHEKPFRCDVEDCTYKDGFMNTNDLERHKKSVHYKGVYGKTKSYRCCGRNCRRPDKIWPRMDNFKTHVKTMHRDEDLNDIIARSEIKSTEVEKLPEVRASGSAAIPQAGPSLSSNMADDNQMMQIERRTSGTVMPQIDPEIVQSNNGLDVLSAVAAMSTAQPATVAKEVDPLQSLTLAMNAFMNVVQQIQGVVLHQNNTTEANSNDQAVKNNPTETQPTSSHTGRTASVQVEAANNMLIGQLEAMVRSLKQKSPNAAQQPSDMPPAQIAPTCETGADCPKCGVHFKRTCDLNKHMRRHTKPYGCTFASCDKVFGSKNDWKRHENSQHFQSEYWKCQIRCSGKLCNVVAYVESDMRQHLLQKHHVPPSAVTSHLEASHAGRNNQDHFWCGFCGEMVELKQTANAAWDERFSHIDNHFIKQNRSIDDWIDVYSNVTKREMAAEEASKNQHEEDMPTPTANNPVPASTFQQSDHQDNKKTPPEEHSRKAGKRRATSPPDEDLTTASSSRRKRKLTSSKMPHIYMTCCRCDQSSIMENSPLRCVFCGESWCPNCGQEELTEQQERDMAPAAAVAAGFLA